MAKFVIWLMLIASLLTAVLAVKFEGMNQTFYVSIVSAFIMAITLIVSRKS